MMPSCASLHADETRRKLAEECDHLLAAKLPDKNNLVLFVDAMNLEYILGQIDTDCVWRACRAVPIWEALFLTSVHQSTTSAKPAPVG